MLFKEPVLTSPGIIGQVPNVCEWNKDDVIIN